MKPGVPVVIALTVFAGLLAVPAVSHTSVETTVSLMASSMAFVAMAITQFLAARPPFTEPMFGGLDRIYQVHRKIGISVLILILIHYFITPNFRGLSFPTGLSVLAKDMGKYAFYGFLCLLVLSLVKVIPKTKIGLPYHLWRLSHRLMGVLFIMVAFHQMFIKRPYSSTALIATYLNIFALIGIASYFYTQFLAFFKTRRYEVADVVRHHGATIVTARPKGGRLKARAGQFGFVRAGKPGLREPHPFTIAGFEDDGTVRFAIKPLGDFTRALRETIAVGDSLRLEGGYGRFNHRRGGDKQIWLAGGIGVTPFWAMASKLTGEERQTIHMVYCVRDRAEAIGLETFEAQAARLANFHFVLHDSSQHGRLDAAKLAAGAQFSPAEADLWFCGPPQLRAAIEAGLKNMGQKPRRVEYERFEFR